MILDELKNKMKNYKIFLEIYFSACIQFKNLFLELFPIFKKLSEKLVQNFEF